MSAVDGEEDLTLAVVKPTKARPRRLRKTFLSVLTAQYILVAICVSLSVAGALRYLVAPQIVAKFDAIAAALTR